MEKICKTCEHCEKDDDYLRCMNPESDLEFTNDENNDNYLDIVEENHSCTLWTNRQF